MKLNAIFMGHLQAVDPALGWKGTVWVSVYYSTVRQLHIPIIYLHNFS